MNGVLGGAFVAAILLPLAAGLTLACKMKMVGPSAMSDRLANAIAAYVAFGFPLAFVFWLFFIITTVPLWTALCRHGNPGPSAAALLGALIGIPAGWYTAGVASVQGSELLITMFGFVVAGAGGGATTWWRAYRPGALRGRLRLCPILGHCGA